jgi:hypothetical protein
MRYRIAFLTGLAVGFLAGARAGRERYEQIMKAGRQAAGHPAVQRATKTITVKTTEISKTAVSQVPKLVETARSKAGDQLGKLPKGKKSAEVPEPRVRSDSPSANGARATS